MQRRLFIVIGIFLAIIVLGVGGYLLFQQGSLGGIQPAEPEALSPGAQEQEVPTVSVIVARQPIPRGSEFIEGSLTRQDFPADRVPPNAIVSETETIGQVAKVEIFQGQIILRDFLQSKAVGLTGEAAFDIPPGYVMVAFPIDRQSSVGYAIQAGDFVDVLMTVSFIDMDPEFQTVLPNKFSFVEGRQVDEEGNVTPPQLGTSIDEGRLAIENQDFPGIEFPREDQRPRRVAQLTVQSAKIIRVGPWKEEPRPAPVEGEAPPPEPLPDVISLAVTPQDALVLLWARQTQVIMELALRAAGDEQANHNSEAVTLQYMLTRFNIAVPPKLEFAIDKSDDPAPVGSQTTTTPPPAQ